MKTLDFDYPRKKEETILVFPQKLFEGKVPDVPTLATNCIWMSRDLANANTDQFRQAATYNIIFKLVGDEVKVALYSRAGGDAKLTSMLSIGYGGHPETIDLITALHEQGGDFHAPMTLPLFRQVIKHSGHREVTEEVRLDFQMVEDPSTPVEEHLIHPTPLVEFQATVDVTYEDDTTPQKVRVKVGDEVPVLAREADGDTIVMRPAGELVVGDVVRYYGEDISVFNDRTVTAVKKNDIGTYHVGFVTFIQVHPLTIASSTNPETDNFIGWTSLSDLEKLREECRLENWSASAVTWVETLVSNPKFKPLAELQEDVTLEM